MTNSRRARIRRMNPPPGGDTCGSFPGPRAPGCVETIGDVERCALPSRIGGHVTDAQTVISLRGTLNQIKRLSDEIERGISSFYNPPAWVDDKLAHAAFDLASVAGFLRGQR